MKRRPIIGKFQLNHHVSVTETIGIFHYGQHIRRPLLLRESVIKSHSTNIHKCVFVYGGNINAAHRFELRGSFDSAIQASS